MWRSSKGPVRSSAVTIGAVRDELRLMPYLHFEYGFEAAMLVMIAIALAMIVFFKRRRWV